MTSQEFVFWIKGYLAAQTYDSQIKIDIEKVLNQVNESNNYVASPNSTSTYTIKQQLND